jgi:hypothetical protein
VGLLVPDSALPEAGSEPPVALEPPLELSPPAELDPPVPDDVSPVAPLELSLLSLSAPPEVDSLVLALSSLVPSAVVEDLVGVVAVVAVVLVRVASLSAVVLLGGVISGVLRGTASETLLPPHAPSAKPQASASASAPTGPRLLPGEIRGAAHRSTSSPIRGELETSSPVALTRPAGPSAGRRSGIR